MTRIPIVGFLTLLTCGALGQAPAQTVAKSLVFDVASIKVNNQTIRRDGPSPPQLDAIHVEPDGVTMRAITMMACIKWAFEVNAGQITGPEWLRSEHFDIAAKASGLTSDGQLRQMMQALLADRFKLAVHRETKQLSVYNLVEAKGGIKCKPEEGDGEAVVTPARGGVATIQRANLSLIADLLSDELGQPVINQTGLKGRFTCTADPRPYVPDPSQPIDRLSMIITLLQEQFGLKLEAKKQAVEMVIVDHLEKTPTAN
jgi:uncharacterized protein (TIGR03435 family)